MPNLDLANYDADLRALADLVTDAKAGGGTPRVQRASSKVIHDVNVLTDGRSVTILLQEGSLYVKGFRNKHATWYFQGEAYSGAKNLKFSCSYVGSNSLGILTQRTSETAMFSRNRGAIDSAVFELAKFNSDNDLDLKVPLALMAHVVSEAIRFRLIRELMAEVCSYTRSFTFAELADYVQNWDKISAGKPPEGVIPNSLYTSFA